MALLMMLISLVIIVSSETRNHVVPNEAIQNKFNEIINHVKKVNTDTVDIRKEMEYISSNSIHLYRRIFDEYFNNKPPSFTEHPPAIDFYTKHQFPPSSAIYILGAGTIATYEATGTSDLDILIIVIEEDGDKFDQATLAVNALADAVQGYGDNLVKTAKVLGDEVDITGAGLKVDIPSEWIKIYPSLKHFQDDVAKFNPLRNGQEINTLAQSTPILLMGNAANYHDLMRHFWTAIDNKKRKDLFDKLIKIFYAKNGMGRDKWVTTLPAPGNAVYFDIKKKILRPLTLPTMYFYELAFYEKHKYARGSRERSTLRRLYFLGEWGYIDIEQIQNIEHTFLWAHKRQLKSNMVDHKGDGTEIHIRHGKKTHVSDGTIKNEIETHLAKVEIFMDHMMRKFDDAFKNKYN